MFKVLNETEVQQYQEWAREQFVPDEEPNPLWHPVVVEEWQRLQSAHEFAVAAFAEA